MEKRTQTVFVFLLCSLFVSFSLLIPISFTLILFFLILIEMFIYFLCFCLFILLLKFLLFSKKQKNVLNFIQQTNEITSAQSHSYPPSIKMFQKKKKKSMSFEIKEFKIAKKGIEIHIIINDGR